ncbi:MAG: bifunctional (p)ppGpp synthetase/guanosine-3',5'-bis(diphosphate) 3'-pyrophosphohydrolase [Lachnospiraceae bacterium]|nr:bifunctional (p)ppGpp synthetase/guanosine-3',5'-bis(diphosphate) 3'-pyrophosphohydrolase [Lachnospiraceae bacterium]
MVEETLRTEVSIARPADFTPEKELHDRLIGEIRSYNPTADLSKVEEAYRMAVNAHKDQKRKSGEPYIIHPLNVALILAELELDLDSIIASLLHDVIEDTDVTYQDIEQKFGTDVANIVDGVSKVTQIDWSVDKGDVEAENLRKMFMAMAKDIRVILVKLADRLHNMRTYQFWSPETQQRKARETMEIFSPVASRLGISKIKVELDDRSLAILHPEVFRELKTRLEYSEAQRDKFIEYRKNEIAQRLQQEGIEAEISGRVKHYFSIYKKMTQQNKTLDQIYDVFAIRIIVKDVINCYAALGVVHEMFTPLPGRFKDYIAMPKPNRYQSLHTTVMSANGVPFEIQIRTEEMHRIAEYGIAAHWKYKEKGSVQSGTNSDEEKLSWLRSIMDWTNTDSEEFVRLLKDEFDLFSGYVYCFTPTGEVKALPADSTPVDFAYAIHSAVGNRMVGAKVNDTLVPIDYKLQNGDRVEILTSQKSRGPSRDWLKIVKSSQARNKINQWFKAQNKEDNIRRGQDAFYQYCRQHGVNAADITKPQYVQACLRKYRFPDWDNMMASIGHGGLKEGQVVNKLLEEYRKETTAQLTDEELLKSIEENSRVRMRTKSEEQGITVKGLKDLSVRFLHCCNPVPGDEIIGYITRGRGISIHRTDCPNVLSMPDAEKARLVPADWSADTDSGTGKYTASIQIYCRNRIGMFADVARVLTENGIDIRYASSKLGKQGVATIEVSFEVGNVEEVNRINARLMSIPDIIEIRRAAG